MIACVRCVIGVAGYKRSLDTANDVYVRLLSRTDLERSAKESDSLVSERLPNARVYTPKYRRARGILRESVQTIG